MRSRPTSTSSTPYAGWPTGWAAPLRRWRSPGCLPRGSTSCRSRAPRRCTTSRRTRQQPTYGSDPTTWPSSTRCPSPSAPATRTAGREIETSKGLTWICKDASLTNAMETTQAKAPGRGVSRTLRPTTKQLPEHARRHNRSLVLQTLFHSGPSSRADLARETHLTRVTVSDLVGQLIEEGLLQELGQRPGSRVGKPATLVGLNPDAFHIVCLDLSDEARLIGAVLDLSGNVLQRSTMRMQGRTGEAAVAGITELCQELLGLATRPVLGVGIGSPGVVDPDGVVLQAPNLGWTDLPLAAKLAAELGLPVHVANDANTAALGEHTYGGAGGSGLMVIAIGKGVGAGLLLDGALLGGHHYAAGEIGHVIVDERGQVCACGRRGCLETVVSAPALRAAIKGLDARKADEA